MIPHPFLRYLPTIRLAGFVIAILALALLPTRASEDHGGGSPAAAEEIAGPLLAPDSTAYNVVKYVGKYHVMLIHFPIAFLLAAALVQWFVVAQGSGQTVATTMIWFGALGAVAAAALGWMYAYDSVYFGDDEQLLFWHRWLGTGTAALATIVLLLHRKLGPKSLAFALTLVAAVLAAAGHYGASLVYGPDFLLKF